MAVKIIDISQELFYELDEPDDISMASISFWVRTSIGALNNLLGTSFSLNESTLEISPDMTILEAAIFKTMYHIYYLDRKIRGSLGASSTIEVSSDNGVVRKSSNVERAKSYTALRNQMSKDLNGQVVNYLNGQASPLAVYGDDTVPGCGIYRWNSRTKGD